MLWGHRGGSHSVRRPRIVILSRMDACATNTTRTAQAADAAGAVQPAGAAGAPQAADAAGAVQARFTDDEVFVQVEHAMNKLHHIVFLAAVSPDCVQIARLYPEGPSQAYFRRSAIRDLYLYCNRDGLFSVSLDESLRQN